MKLLLNLLLLAALPFAGCSQPAAQKGNAPLGNRVSTLADSILVIHIDKNNNQWFGSNGRGVYKYNGYALTQYTTQHGLSNNRIWAINEDAQGNLYFTTATSVDKFDGNSITPLPIDTNTNQWQLKPGDLWFKVGTDDGHPYRYDGKKLHRLTFPKNPREDDYRAMYPSQPFSPYSIYTIYTDSKGRIWFGTGALGVGCYNGHSFKWIAEDDLTEIHNGPSNGVRSIIEDKSGNFWFSNTNYRYTISQTAIHTIEYKKLKGIEWPSYWAEKDGFEYMSATVDSTGRIWFATYNNGVFMYDFKNHYEHVMANTIKTNLFAIYQSKYGTLWLATHTGGVYRWDGKFFNKLAF